MESKLVFLHVSDIHLREEELSSGIELDHDLRNELVLDVRRLRGDAFDSLDGVLLTGDVAFAGKAVEFASARAWLDELRHEFGFSEGGVWCVPGNHDVDHATIANSALLRTVRASVRAGGEDRAASVLHELLEDQVAHATLLEPLSQYNDRFANGFQCTTKCPALSWSDKIPFAGRYEVVLHGLNSAVISDSRDNVETGRLVLGAAQASAVSRRPGAINVSLCHHPPRWLLDQRAVLDHLNSRTTLQLFGHEHDSRIERLGNSVRVFAGALHPQRDEPKWEPRFNLIVLVIKEPAASTEMLVRIWPRAWDRAATEFRPAPTSDRVPYESYMIPLPEPLPAEDPANVSVSPPELFRRGPLGSLETTPTPTVVPVEEARRMPRDIVYRFFQLSWIQRMRIAMDLGLCSNEDADVDEAEMGRRVFVRAREQEKLDELGSAIDRGLAESRTSRT